MIRPYLTDLINEHKPTAELIILIIVIMKNNRAKWKIQLVMQNSFISDKKFEDTCTSRNFYG